MIEFILAAVIVIAFILFGVLIFIWIQINSSDSRLVRIIENRIRLNNIHFDIDRIKPLVIEEVQEDII